MSGVVCCVYGQSLKPERLKLSSLPLSESVDNLKAEVAKQTAIPEAELIPIFCGKRLNGADSLSSCGVQSGMTVHLLRKPVYDDVQMPLTDKIDCSDVGLQRLIMALKTAVRSPVYRSTVQQLSKPHVLENVIAATPGLAEDPIAIAILQDPDLLLQFADFTTLQKAVQLHPVLVEAINHIVAAVHEEVSAVAGNSLPAASSYLLDALSDDDDLDVGQDQAGSSGTSQPPSHAESASHSLFPPITPAQLASALAAVETANSMTPSSSSEGSSIASSSVPGAQSAPLISSELFNQAIQQALSSATQTQLQQLRDMGINDDAVSLRALQITNGDVQAALELIFGDGAMGESSQNLPF